MAIQGEIFPDKGKGRSTSAAQEILRFSSHRFLRQRLVLCILSGRSIRVDNIRPDDVHVGLRDYEINLLRLVERITNGSTIDISVTGTSFVLHPGILPGGRHTHTCHLGRSIGYYLELLVPLAPFCKKPLTVTLHGITGSVNTDLTVDSIRTVTLPHLHMFGIEDMELKIIKRGSAPLGGGEITFSSPIVRHLKTIQVVDPGKIGKLRGIAYSTRVSPQFANRMVEAARGILNTFVPDTYLYTDVFKGEESGKSPGFGITLVAQSSTYTLHSAESSSATSRIPEEVGVRAARLLLKEVQSGGCVDSRHQWLVLLFMALGKEDVGKCLFGQLTSNTVQFMRDMQASLGVRFRITDAGSNLLLLSCLGVGYSNVNKRVD
ncbi:RNA-3'-phosphate cyclase [Kockovaella imperatae]|uniref:RNA-3'-phosphate cyclase n=1 Tax=Kockovaella imperatae TaxID=4999 RepID=A0A1Y1ULU9_9TREE|nr:RNA-3'-phosphate cyclase [Kockovaella imperatae]ORX38456.1 RNA-3'-phosphate cyclase [Kockovaella imperatae]